MSVFKNMKAAYKFASQKRMDKPSRMRYIIYRQENILYLRQESFIEYGLTELGTKMLPIVDSLADFGNYYKSITEQN